MPIKYERQFDLNQAGNFTKLELNGATTATVQVSLPTDSTPSAFVLTILRSNDGNQFVALSTPQTISYSAFSASILSAMSAAIDCSAFGWLGVKLTTVEGADITCDIWIHAQRVGG